MTSRVCRHELIAFSMFVTWGRPGSKSRDSITTLSLAASSLGSSTPSAQARLSGWWLIKTSRSYCFIPDIFPHLQ